MVKEPFPPILDCCGSTKPDVDHVMI